MDFLLGRASQNPIGCVLLISRLHDVNYYKIDNLIPCNLCNKWAELRRLKMTATTIDLVHVSNQNFLSLCTESLWCTICFIRWPLIRAFWLLKLTLMQSQYWSTACPACSTLVSISLLLYCLPLRCCLSISNDAQLNEYTATHYKACLNSAYVHQRRQNNQ